MRSPRPAVVLIAVVGLLAACGEPQLSSSTPKPNLLYLSSGTGIAVIEPGSAVPTFQDEQAVATRDWSTVVRSYQSDGLTRVAAVDPVTGDGKWERALPQGLQVKVVSPDGDLLALGPVGERPYLAGRSETKLVIASRGVSEPRTIVLDGNFEPEAFSTDGKSLFIIRYLPARNPSRYQVRRLDMATGEVLGVYTPDAHLQRAMGGTARVQVGSTDGSRLYTLYTLNLQGRNYAFIHVLSLDGLWAHCIDLPTQFARSADWASAMAVSSDGRRLYVANAATGALAEIDTGKLSVLRTTKVDFVSGGPTHALRDSGSTLYLAGGRQVVAVDVDSFEEDRSWRMKERVRGLQLDQDELNLYVGLRNRVAVLDLTTSHVVDTLNPPGVGRIDQFGPVQRPVADGLFKISRPRSRST